jgi:hypothetical protein
LAGGGVTAWTVFFEFQVQIDADDEHINELRDDLRAQLEAATGLSARSKTIQTAAYHAAVRPLQRFSTVEGQSQVLPMLGRKGRVVA